MRNSTREVTEEDIKQMMQETFVDSIRRDSQLRQARHELSHAGIVFPAFCYVSSLFKYDKRNIVGGTASDYLKAQQRLNGEN